MDLRQETEVVDGVECQLITWIDENYNPDDPTSIAMHCVAFGTDDHLLRSYMALDSGGESRFALRFKNINTNPSFGPDDFTFGPDVRVTHVKTDEEFGIELQKLFMKKMVQAALKPKKKHRRHTNGGQGEAIPPPEESPESIPEPEAPAEVSRWRLTGRWAFCAGVLIALGVVAIMYWLQKRKHS